MRVIHFTFYKCASQWVRDILTDPEISLVSGYPLSVGGADVCVDRTWPEFPQSTFAGPIYSASYDDWITNSNEDDRALVVLRDPRDLIVSLVFSLAFSHVPSSITRLLRSPISAASDRDRVRIGIFLLTQWADRMRSWGTAPASSRHHIATYTRLIQNPKDEFSAICRFLGWPVEPRLLHRVVDRYSFENRTGRKPGEVNPYSHLRKGMDGDWVNHFDRELGKEFEETFPQLLFDLGFETSKDWYKSLPEAPPPPEQIPSGSARVQELLSKIASFEDRYTELVLWRTAAEDRLQNIRELTLTVNELQSRVAAPNLDTVEHLSQIRELTATVRHLELVSAERLANNQRLIANVQELHGRLEEKNTIAVERLEQVYELTRRVHDWEEIAEQRIRDMGYLNAAIASLKTRATEAETSAAERLEQVTLLTRHVHILENQVALPNVVAEERLADILKLTAHIELLRQELAEVKKAAEERKRIIDEIRASASYRYGFVPISMFGKLFR